MSISKELTALLVCASRVCIQVAYRDRSEYIGLSAKELLILKHHDCLNALGNDEAFHKIYATKLMPNPLVSYCPIELDNSIVGIRYVSDTSQVLFEGVDAYRAAQTIELIRRHVIAAKNAPVTQLSIKMTSIGVSEFAGIGVYIKNTVVNQSSLIEITPDKRLSINQCGSIFSKITGVCHYDEALRIAATTQAPYYTLDEKQTSRLLQALNQ